MFSCYKIVSFSKTECLQLNEYKKFNILQIKSLPCSQALGWGVVTLASKRLGGELKVSTIKCAAGVREGRGMIAYRIIYSTASAI